MSCFYLWFNFFEHVLLLYIGASVICVNFVVHNSAEKHLAGNRRGRHGGTPGWASRDSVSRLINRESHKTYSKNVSFTKVLDRYEMDAKTFSINNGFKQRMFYFFSCGLVAWC